MKCINFKRTKKHQLPNDQDEIPVTSVTRHYAFNDPVAGIYGLTSEDITTLFQANPNAAIFTSIDISDFQRNENIDSSETDSATETEENCLPDTLTSLFDPSTINIDQHELTNLCEARYREYVQTYTQNNYDNLTQKTKTQSLSTMWMMHRAGRITASTAKQVYSMRDEPSESLIKIIMQYGELVDNRFTRYGKETEPKAREFYKNKIQNEHHDLKVEETGFHVNAEYPYLGATPDGLVYCSCHESKVLEIKCPYKYKNGLLKWETDKDFILDNNCKAKNNHPYYFQMQLQMLLTGFNYADLLIYSPVDNGKTSLITTVKKDEELLNNFKIKALHVFKTIILPEIITRRRDTIMENSRKAYCICKRPSFGNMIACDNSKCKTEWYHYSCVSITRAPRGKWFCEACKSARNKHN